MERTFVGWFRIALIKCGNGYFFLLFSLSLSGSFLSPPVLTLCVSHLFCRPLFPTWNFFCLSIFLSIFIHVFVSLSFSFSSFFLSFFILFLSLFLLLSISSLSLTYPSSSMSSSRFQFLSSFSISVLCLLTISIIFFRFFSYSICIYFLLFPS